MPWPVINDKRGQTYFACRKSVRIARLDACQATAVVLLLFFGYTKHSLVFVHPDPYYGVGTSAYLAYGGKDDEK